MSVVEPAAKAIRSTIPARLDRLSWSPFHTRMVAGLGAAWILDGLQITIASSVTGELTKPQTLGMSSTEIGLIASIYLIGEMVGALFFGRLSDKLGRKRLLIMTLLLYLFGHRRGRLRHRPSHRLARLLLPDPVRGRGGHRRPVRRDQLRNRRDDAVQVQGTGRHLDQRHVLGRSDPRLLRLAHLPQRVRGQRRLAARLPDGPGARSRRDLRRPHAAREPALADDARTDRGGGSQSPDDRGRRPKVGTGARGGRRLPRDRARPGKAVRLHHIPPARVPHIPEASDPRRDTDDHAVVPLQRDLLHLRARAGEVLRRQRDQGAPLRPCVLGRQPDRPASARTAVRHGRTQEDDLWHVHPLRRAARDQRLALPATTT